MKNDERHTTSLWAQSLEIPLRPLLAANITADVCVIGAGIAGLTTAYLLAREGKAVVVLDDGSIGGGETCRTTAHLTTALDDRYLDLERLHGVDGTRLAAQSHAAAIERIAAIVAAERMECELERLSGYLFSPPGEETDVLDQELQAAHRAGLTDVERVERAPMSHYHTGPCLRFPRQAQFHPLKYLRALAGAIESHAGRIFTGTHAAEFDAGPPGRVTTSHGFVVTAQDIVVATNTPVNNSVRIHTKQAAYRTYVIGARIPPGSVTRALYWDTADPFHYVRLQHDEVLIVGGEDHKTGQDGDAAERFNRLESWTRERFPMAGAVAFRWSGQIIESIDGLAFIGLNASAEPNLYIATGDSGNGMTHGTIAGLLLTDLILGRENEWKSLYDPMRIRFGAAAEFTKENLNAAAQFRDYVTGGDSGSLDEIGAGEGVILQKGLTKVAVSRDATGVLREISAVCPHLGCVVRWNSTEATWDCPCHGSRYTISGKVINGPSNADLEPV